MTPAPLTGVTRLRVRYGETDAGGIVHHPAYFNYFEIGRTELLRGRGVPYSDLERRGARLVVVEVRCRYRAPARYDDLLEIRTTLAELTAVRVGFRYEVAGPSGRILAEGFTLLACVDPAGRPRRLPPEVAAALRPDDSPRRGAPPPAPPGAGSLAIPDAPQGSLRSPAQGAQILGGAPEEMRPDSEEPFPREVR